MSVGPVAAANATRPTFFIEGTGPTSVLGDAAVVGGAGSVKEVVASALAVKARMAPKDAAAAASALASDFGVTDFEDIGLLDEADVLAVAASLCSVSRKKFEALWCQLGGGGGDGAIEAVVGGCKHVGVGRETDAS